MSTGVPLIKRFWEKVDVKGPDDCWNWTAHLSSGYGRFIFNDRKFLAHRYAKLGDTLDLLDPTKIVMHLCNNTKCCNPNHLKIGTNQENIYQAAIDCKKANRIWGRAGSGRLKNGEIWLIRRLLTSGISQRLIAKIFKCSQPIISMINNNRLYKQEYYE